MRNIKIIFFILILTFQQLALAGTYTVTSVPYQVGYGFSYRDAQGNSVSISDYRNVPIITQTYPNAVWIPAQNGSVPPTSIIYEYVNGAPVFYCKVQVEGDIYYGQLVPGQGCDAPDVSDAPVSDYWVLGR